MTFFPRRFSVSLTAIVLGLSELSAPAFAQTPAPRHGIDPAYMDRSVSPTADFYEFANGAWMKTAKIEDQYPEAGVGLDVFLHTNEQVGELVASAAKKAASGNVVPGSNEQKIGDFYRIANDEALANQFNAYEPVPGTHINGRVTLGEKITYLAYHRALAGKEPPKIDGFTGDQRFFLAYAQAWRQKDRPEAVKLLANTDPHSPAEYRVRGPLANTPAFWKAFGADAKTAPSAANTVTIW